MSSYDAFETSRESSRPIEIYEFSIGGTTHRYTSSEDDVTVNGNDYLARSIGRSNLAQGSEDHNRTVNITLPGNDEFVTQYKNIAPGQKATVSIIRLQRDEVPTFNTQILRFKGELKSVSFPDNGNTAQINAQGIESSLNQNIPRFTYSGQCNHVLYDLQCGVDPSNFDHLGIASSVSGNVLQVSGADGQADGFWTAGYATPVGQNDFRLILSHAGTSLTLLLPFASDVTGMQIQIFAGCNHVLTDDCAQKFDNVLEFGGFGFGPLRNIFRDGIV